MPTMFSYFWAKISKLSRKEIFQFFLSCCRWIFLTRRDLEGSRKSTTKLSSNWRYFWFVVNYVGIQFVNISHFLSGSSFFRGRLHFKNSLFFRGVYLFDVIPLFRFCPCLGSLSSSMSIRMTLISLGLTFLERVRIALSSTFLIVLDCSDTILCWELYIQAVNIEGVEDWWRVDHKHMKNTRTRSSC